MQQSYIPLLKALICGINAIGAQGSGCMFTLCHAPLKMAVLLHKTEKVSHSFSGTVSRRDFKFMDQDSYGKYLITLNVYTYIVKNRRT